MSRRSQSTSARRRWDLQRSRLRQWVLRQNGVVIVTPPQVVGQLVDDDPSVVSFAVRAMAARKTRPPMSPVEVVVAIVRQQGFGALEDSLHDLVD